MPKCTANKITKILINLLLQSSYFAGNSLHCIMDNYQLLKLLETETQAIEFCVRYGLLPDGKPGDCVNCSAKQSCVWAEDKRANGIQFVIKCKICHKSHSIAKNTWFEQSKTSIKNVLLVVYSFLRGFTLNQAALQTGVSLIFSLYRFLIFLRLTIFGVDEIHINQEMKLLMFSICLLEIGYLFGITNHIFLILIFLINFQDI